MTQHDNKRRAERTEIRVPCHCKVIQRESLATLASFKGALTDTTFAGCRIDTREFPAEHAGALTRGECLIDVMAEVNGVKIDARGQVRWINDKSSVVFGVEFLSVGDALKGEQLHRMLHPEEGRDWRTPALAAAVLVMVVSAGLFFTRKPELGGQPSAAVVKKQVPPKVTAAHTTDDTSRPSGPTVVPISVDMPPQAPSLADHDMPPSPGVLAVPENIEQHPGSFSARFRVPQGEVERMKFVFLDQHNKTIEACRYERDTGAVMVSCRLDPDQIVQSMTPVTMQP